MSTTPDRPSPYRADAEPAHGPTAAQRFAAAALLFSVAQLLSRVLGFARDAYIAAAFGATGATDAFYAAFTIPDLLMYLVAGGTLAMTFLPMYRGHLARGDGPAAEKLYSVIATTMGLALLAGTLALEAFTPAIAARYLHRLRPADLAEAVRLTRILLPTQLCFYLGSLSAATLQARDRNRVVAAAPLIYNAGTIVGGVLLGRWLGMASLAWGSLAGAVVGPLGLQVIAARRYGARLSFDLAPRFGEFRTWLRKTLPLMVGVSLVTADDWIIRYFAAGDTGAISCVSYASKLVNVPRAVAVQAIGLAAINHLTAVFARGDEIEGAEQVRRTARGSATVAALAGGALAALAVPAVDLLFGHGHFSASQVRQTASYLVAFAVAIPAWGVQGILTRAFYARRDTLTPMVAGTVVTALSLPVYWLCFRAMGVVGLVVASGLGMLLHTVALLALIHRVVPALDRALLLGDVARAGALAALAALPTWAIAHAIPTLPGLPRIIADALRLAAGGTVFVLVTAVLAAPLGVSEARVLIERVLGRLRRRRGT